MGSSPDTISLTQLDSLVQTVQTLIQDILASTRSPPPTSTSTSISPSPSTPSTSSTPTGTVSDPIALARDSATLIRASVTKLSLLIINEPFTPSAIARLLSDLVAPLLALLSAVQAAPPAHYTLPFHTDLAYRCGRLLAELGSFLAKIPRDGKALSGAQTDGFSAERGSIPATGLVWSACDGIIGLADMGSAGFFTHKVSGWRDIIDDIMQELKEWGEQDPDDADDDDDAGSHDGDGDDVDAAQDLLDQLMTQQAIPASDPDNIRPRLATALRKIRLVVLLYQTVVKRRVKKLPAFPLPAGNAGRLSVAERLEQIALRLGQLPDSFGDLAAAFYELQPAAIDEAMAQCFSDAASASELLNENWNGAQDEFTAWAEKFRSEILKT